MKDETYNKAEAAGAHGRARDVKLGRVRARVRERRRGGALACVQVGGQADHPGLDEGEESLVGIERRNQDTSSGADEACAWVQHTGEREEVPEQDEEERRCRKRGGVGTRHGEACRSKDRELGTKEEGPRKRDVARDQGREMQRATARNETEGPQAGMH